jgi:hypothetical protein
MECGKTPRHLPCRWQTVRVEAMQPSGRLQQPDVTGSSFLFRLFQALLAGVESIAFIEPRRITAGFARNIFPPYDLFCVRYSPWLFAIHPALPSPWTSAPAKRKSMNPLAGMGREGGYKLSTVCPERTSRDLTSHSVPDLAGGLFHQRRDPAKTGHGDLRSIADVRLRHRARRRR